MNSNPKAMVRSLMIIGLAGVSMGTLATQPTLSGDFMRTLKEATQKTQVLDNSYAPYLAQQDHLLKLQNAAGCEGSDDKGCAKVRDKLRDQFQSSASAVATAIPAVKEAWTDMKNVARREVREKVARQSFEELSKELAGIKAQDQVKVNLQRKGGIGQLLQHISSLDEAFSVGAASERSPALTASQVYLTMHFAIEGLDSLKQTIDVANVTIETGRMLGSLSPMSSTELGSLKQGAGLDRPYGNGLEAVSFDSGRSGNVQWANF